MQVWDERPARESLWVLLWDQPHANSTADHLVAPTIGPGTGKDSTGGPGSPTSHLSWKRESREAAWRQGRGLQESLQARGHVVMGVGWYSWGLSERWQLGKLGVPFAPPSLSPQAGAELGKESLPMPNAFWGHPGVGGTVGPLSRPAGNLAEELALGLAGPWAGRSSLK